MRFIEGRGEIRQPVPPDQLDIKDANLGRKPLRRITGGPAAITLATALSLGACVPPSGAEPNPSGEVLGAETKSIEELFQGFIKKYDGQPVEKNDPSNLNQCVDLVYAWIDELGIPRDSIQNFDPARPYAYQIFTNADDETRQYFDVIPMTFTQNGYPSDLPEVGDIMVWKPSYNSGVGHTGIANGFFSVAGKPDDLFGAFVQNDPPAVNPENNVALNKEYQGYQNLLGYLRPKGFHRGEIQTPPPAAEAIDYESLSENEKAKYNFTQSFFQKILGSSGFGNENSNYIVQTGELYQNGNIVNGDGLNAIMRKLVKGEEVGELVYDLSIERYRNPDESETFGQKRIGRVYFDELGLDIASAEQVSAADKRNGIDWRGEVVLTGIIKYGIRDIWTNGDENTENLRAAFFQITPDDIENYSPWLDMQKSSSVLIMSEPPIAIPALIEYGPESLSVDFYTSWFADDENHPDIFELFGFLSVNLPREERIDIP